MARARVTAKIRARGGKKPAKHLWHEIAAFAFVPSPDVQVAARMRLALDRRNDRCILPTNAQDEANKSIARAACKPRVPNRIATCSVRRPRDDAEEQTCTTRRRMRQAEVSAVSPRRGG